MTVVNRIMSYKWCMYAQHIIPIYELVAYKTA